MSESFRVAFVSGKLGGVDGVSLEVDKWIDILSDMGHTVYTIAGRYAASLRGVAAERQLAVEKIRFDAPEQRHYELHFFPHLSKHPPTVSVERRQQIVEDLTTQAQEITGSLYDIVQQNDIDVIIAENTNAMPMTLLGGMAVHSLATERRVATLFHHHDFWWERSRFSQNHIEALLNRIMPPVDLGTEHVVISSYASHILSSLKRVRPRVIPNCEDFEEAIELDEYNGDFRRELGFRDDDLLIVQPTRIVRRKRIEDSVQLVGRLLQRHPHLADRIHYIVSLYQGDEPDDDYVSQIQRHAERLDVRLHLISDRVASVRGRDQEGRKLYTNRDVLANADAVTYLPIWEGFGNALLEAVAARVPLVTTTYLVYKTDIKMAGFRNIEIRDQYDEHGHLVIPDKAVDDLEYVLTHPEMRREIVDHNFEVGRREFGMGKLQELMRQVMHEYADEIKASRNRLKKSKALYSV